MTKKSQYAEELLQTGENVIQRHYSESKIDDLFFDKLVPGVMSLAGTKKADEGQLEMTASHMRTMFKDYPEEIEALIGMSVRIGIGLAVHEEIR
jgi:hypothetical protein